MVLPTKIMNFCIVLYICSLWRLSWWWQYDDYNRDDDKDDDFADDVSDEDDDDDNHNDKSTAQIDADYTNNIIMTITITTMTSVICWPASWSWQVEPLRVALDSEPAAESSDSYPSSLSSEYKQCSTFWLPSQLQFRCVIVDALCIIYKLQLQY